MKAILAMTLGLILAGSAMAHGKDEKGKAAAKATKSAAAALTGAAKAGLNEMAEGAKAAGELDLGALFKQSLSSHHHNRLVHFPIALGLVAAFFGLLSYRDESFKRTATWLFFLAAVSAILAYLAGKGAEEALEPMSHHLHQAVEAHEAQGLYVLCWLWFSWATSLGTWARKWAWVVYLLTAMAISLTGMLGGAIAHVEL